MKTLKFVLFVLVGFILVSCSNNFSHLIENLPELDISIKENGTYRGSYNLKDAPISAVVDVDVQNYKISGIRIVEHNCSPIGKKAENIIRRIINRQSLNVDVISGATLSSIAIIKVVEDALQ